MQLPDEDLARIAALIADSEARILNRIAVLIAESEARTVNRTAAMIAESEARTVNRTAAMIAESEARTLNRIEGRLDAIESRINDRMAEAIEISATKLLTAFHSWASPMEQRVRTQREALRALDLQIEEIASRVRRLEEAGDARH